MKKTIWILLLAGLALVACGNGERQVTEPDAAPMPWEQFVTAVIDAYYARNPETAVNAGLHDFDGQMSDYSLAGLNEYAAWVDAVVTEAMGYEDLEGIEAFERDYLLNAMNGQLFWLRESNFPTTNPLFYSADVSVYVDREYAPLEERLVAYTNYIRQVPSLIATMQDNLEPPLPAPYLQMGQAVYAGFADYLETTVPDLFAGVADEQLQRQFAAANGDAVAAVRQAAAWLEGLKATGTGDYALGKERFMKMLSAGQGVNVSLADLKAAGERDLQRNLDVLHEACAEFAPGEDTRDCVLRAQNRKPPEGAVAGATRQLPVLRKFLADNAIVSIPSDEEALVDAAPPHRRFNSAYISIPGPFEKGLPAVYYIAPPDPAWSPEDQLAYIPGETDLLSTSIHEVWPGHFLQFLHSNRVENRVGRHFSTYTFTEGWAHYAEQMMIDAGLGDGDVEVRIGQLLDALLRNVRYLSAIGLHTEGMTVEESQAMFQEKAFKDVGNAAQQAYRGTYDPGYLNYTLGKLMINKLREDWTAGRGGREAWGRFHDQFLSYGSPPIPLLRKQMLGPDYDGDAALLPY
ncbi:MAG: DUF885 domain-containing protein [Gammaproteobacteria bacterium]|nr:DUF885 domain-containing protein [Gammaproteobacteria bacterium]